MIQNRTEAANEMDQLLYSCAQYMAMSDSPRWTDYRYALFDNMTEEQRIAAGKHQILWSYMSAINNCYMKKDFNAAIDDLNGILSVRQDLPMCWYLKGVCSSNLEDFPAAENELKQANKLQANIPSVMYSLANVEDALENYAEAYEWCRRVKAILPEQDHGNDYYGIAIHNDRLMSALEKEINK
jgi:tetratricopeptide (TPR) repeat protein